MRIAPLHSNCIGNDATARLDNKPDSIVFVSSPGKEVLPAPLQAGVVPRPSAVGSPRAEMPSVWFKDGERVRGRKSTSSYQASLEGFVALSSQGEESRKECASLFCCAQELARRDRTFPAKERG